MGLPLPPERGRRGWPNRQTVAVTAETRYARNGQLHVAYQVTGDGPLDVLELSTGLFISIDETSEEPHWQRYVSHLSSFSRLIRFDLRGVGLSDPPPPASTPTLKDMMEDALAVLEATGVGPLPVIGPLYGGAIAMLLAASHPERVRSLVLVNAAARSLYDEDYPMGLPRDVVTRWQEATVEPDPDDPIPDELSDAVLYAPSLAGQPTFREWWSRASRRGASPAAAMALSPLFTDADVRGVLPSITAPTLVIHRAAESNPIQPIGHAHYLVEHIPNARLLVLPGSDLVPYIGDMDALIGPIEEFLTGERHRPQGERMLATIVFTDIVDSTRQAAALGDRRWRSVLEQHHEMVRRQLVRFRGRYVKSTGDGALMTFDGPARAIDCALAIRDGARQLGMEVRVGLHTGEIEPMRDDIGGIAVHIASRVADIAGPGEVLVSRTVTDLVAGSGITFADRGTHELQGTPATWQLYRAEG